MESMELINSSYLLLPRVPTTASPGVTMLNTTKTNAYEWRYILPPYFVIFILSITGNCMVIATLAGNRRMRTVTNVYLLNLAISDFLLGVFCLPFTLVGQVYRRFMFGALMCKLIPFLQAVSVSVDVWTLVAISLERYFAICRPLKSRKWQTQSHAYKMIAIVWMLSLTLNSPILLVSTLQPMRGDAFKCREVWSSLELERAFNLGLDGSLLLMPFFIMSLAYSLIVIKLWRRMRQEIQHNHFTKNLVQQSSCKLGANRTLSTSTLITAQTNVATDDYYKTRSFNKKSTKETNNGHVREADNKTYNYCPHTDLEIHHVVRSTHIDKSIQAKRKVLRMLFVIILEFFVCWTPLHVINTIYLFYPEELYQYVGQKGIVCLQLLAYCSSCCNPITYCFMNRKFRLAFIGVLKNCWLFRKCFPEQLSLKQATQPLSSQEMSARESRGTHTPTPRTAGATRSRGVSLAAASTRAVRPPSSSADTALRSSEPKTATADSCTASHGQGTPRSYKDYLSMNRGKMLSYGQGLPLYE